MCKASCSKIVSLYILKRGTRNSRRFSAWASVYPTVAPARALLALLRPFLSLLPGRGGRGCSSLSMHPCHPGAGYSGGVWVVLIPRTWPLAWWSEVGAHVAVRVLLSWSPTI